MKNRLLWVAILPILIATLPIFLNSASSKPGIGVSDYPTDKIIYVNITKTVEIAQLFNTGTFNFSVRSIWRSDQNSNCNISLPSEFLLTVGEVRDITCEVFSSAIANYSGTVEFIFDVKLPSNSTGNPSLPGHTTKVNFIVKQATIQSIGYNFKTNLLILGTTAISILSLIGTLTFLYHRRKKMLTAKSNPWQLRFRSQKKGEYMKNSIRNRRGKQREAKSQPSQLFF